MAETTVIRGIRFLTTGHNNTTIDWRPRFGTYGSGFTGYWQYTTVGYEYNFNVEFHNIIEFKGTVGSPLNPNVQIYSGLKYTVSKDLGTGGTGEGLNGVLGQWGPHNLITPTNTVGGPVIPVTITDIGTGYILNVPEQRNTMPSSISGDQGDYAWSKPISSVAFDKPSGYSWNVDYSDIVNRLTNYNNYISYFSQTFSLTVESITYFDAMAVLTSERQEFDNRFVEEQGGYHIQYINGRRVDYDNSIIYMPSTFNQNYHITVPQNPVEGFKVVVDVDFINNKNTIESIEMIKMSQENYDSLNDDGYHIQSIPYESYPLNNT